MNKFMEDFDEKEEEEKTFIFSEIKPKKSIKKWTPWEFVHHCDKFNSTRPKSAKNPFG